MKRGAPLKRNKPLRPTGPGLSVTPGNIGMTAICPEGGATTWTHPLLRRTYGMPRKGESMPAGQRQTIADAKPEPRPRLTAIERFLAKVNKTPDGCWVWTGATSSGGYGKFKPQSYVSVYAHRWSYEHFVGEISDGLVIDHLCRNRSCVNPDHLEPVTTAENLFRGEHPSHKANRTNTCKRGHNLKDVPRNRHGWRQCPACRALRARDRSERGAQ